MNADDRIITLALKVGFLTAGQLDEVRQLQGILAQNGVNLTLPEILVKKEFVNKDQLRLLNLGLRHDRVREEDVEVAANLVQSGQVAESMMKETLDAQQQLWAEGRPFPRLAELLQQRGLLDDEKLENLQVRRSSGGSTRRLARAPRRGRSSGDSTKATVKMRIPVRKEPDSGTIVEGCRVDLRKTTLKSGAKGGRTIMIVTIEGLLDGHTFKTFEDYINRVIDLGSGLIVLNCEKLDYVSSAGIGILASAVKRCRERKGDLRLAGVQERVKRIINMVGLQSILRMYEAEKKAVQSYQFM